MRNIYSVIDTIAEEFGPLWEAKNDSVAIRQFKELIKNVSDKENYILYRLGSFDHASGSEIQTDKKMVLQGEILANIEELKNSNKDEKNG